MKNIGGRGVLLLTRFPMRESFLRSLVACIAAFPYLITSLLRHFSQETLSVRNCAAKILGNGLPHVGQRLADSEIHACPGLLGARSARRRKRQDRHVLARMVRRRPAWVGVAA